MPIRPERSISLPRLDTSGSAPMPSAALCKSVSSRRLGGSAAVVAAYESTHTGKARPR